VVWPVQFRRNSSFYHGELPVAIDSSVELLSEGRWFDSRMCVGFYHELARARGERCLTVAAPETGPARGKSRALTA